MDKMTNAERLEAIVKGELPDRVPVHDVACITVAKAMGCVWKDVRYDAKEIGRASCRERVLW